MTAMPQTDERGMPPAQHGLATGLQTQGVMEITEAGWQLLGWVGLAILIAALGTIVPVWLPAQFGNVDWEFGTVADSFVALPLLTVGLGACLAAAVARQRSGALLALGVGCVLLVLWLVISGVLFSTTAVIAWQRAQEAPPLVAVGVKRVIARTVWFGLIGGIGCSLAALYSFKTYVAGPRRNRA